MSGAQSISTRRAYGVQRVCRVWHRARSSVYARRQATRSPAPCRRRGPIGAAPDDVLVAHIRRVLEASPFHGEGYRKAWAKLRVDGIRTSQERVRQLMRESGLQAPPRAGLAGPDAPDADAGLSSPEGVSAPYVPPARSRPDGRSRTPAAARESHETGVVAGVVPAEEGERVTSEIGLPIFTSNDIGVTPPVAVRPRIRAVPQDAAESDVMGVVEAIVSTNGTVESVKSATAP